MYVIIKLVLKTFIHIIFFVFKLINISKPIASKVLIKPCLKHEAFVVFVVCVEIWAWSNAHFSK